MSDVVESELEAHLGLPATVMALWRPVDEPPDLVLDNAWYIRREAPTRRRIAALHLIASSMLNGRYLAASAELDRLGPASIVLAAVRGLVLAEQLLPPSLTVDDRKAIALCSAASDKASALLGESGLGHDPALLRDATQTGESILADVLFARRPQRPLLFRVTDSLSPLPESRYGVACVCIAGYATVLETKDPTGRTARELAEEQAALALAYTQGGIVRWQDGRVVLHD